LKREVIIISGPNGSGKTTFAKDFLKTYKYAFLNADEIARELNPNDLSSVRLEAGKIFLRKVNELIEVNQSFAVETTLSGHYLRKIIETLKFFKDIKR